MRRIRCVAVLASTLSSGKAQNGGANTFYESTTTEDSGITVVINTGTTNNGNSPYKDQPITVIINKSHVAYGNTSSSNDNGGSSGGTPRPGGEVDGSSPRPSTPPRASNPSDGEEVGRDNIIESAAGSGKIQPDQPHLPDSSVAINLPRPDSAYTQPERDQPPLPDSSVAINLPRPDSAYTQPERDQPPLPDSSVAINRPRPDSAYTQPDPPPPSRVGDGLSSQEQVPTAPPSNEAGSLLGKWWNDDYATISPVIFPHTVDIEIEEGLTRRGYEATKAEKYAAEGRVESNRGEKVTRNEEVKDPPATVNLIEVRQDQGVEERRGRTGFETGLEMEGLSSAVHAEEKRIREGAVLNGQKFIREGRGDGRVIGLPDGRQSYEGIPEEGSRQWQEKPQQAEARDDMPGAVREPESRRSRGPGRLAAEGPGT